MRQSEAALALIRRPGPAGVEYLVQWNARWNALNLVGGHRRPQESYRDCLVRELDEELDVRPGPDCAVAEGPTARLEYVAFSKSAGEETAYTMELFEVTLTPAAERRVSADPSNAWVGTSAIRSGRAGDGRPVSDTVRLLLEKAGLLAGNEPPG